MSLTPARKELRLILSQVSSYEELRDEYVAEIDRWWSVWCQVFEVVELFWIVSTEFNRKGFLE